MPGLSFTLPHWLYWVGLIVFPIIAMVLSRRPQPAEKRYTLPLAYMIAVTGGILGLHRFYLKNMRGLVYIPIFLFILYANGQTQDARSVLSDYENQIRATKRLSIVVPISLVIIFLILYFQFRSVTSTSLIFTGIILKNHKALDFFVLFRLLIEVPKV